MRGNDELCWHATRARLSVPLLVNCLLGYERMISLTRNFGAGNNQYHSLLTNKHLQLLRKLGLEDYYAKLKSWRYDKIILAEYLPMLPAALVEIVLGYCHLHQDNCDDLDEIYSRLLQN